MMKKQNNGINFVRWHCRVCNQHLKVWRSKIIQSLMDEEQDPVLSFLNRVMDEELEQPVSSFLNGEEGWNDEYSSISEFKHHLKEDALADEKLKYGWVFWRENEQQLNNTTHLQHKITTLFKHLSPPFFLLYYHYYLVQFWGVVKVEGRRHYLSTSHHPFFVSHLKKGYCWYRKLCVDHVYPVCVEEDGPVEEAQLGGVGRAYRNKHPESTPDLRLYSTNEFPLRDHAARCGFRSYLALPLFDLHTNECCGVLELLSDRAGMDTNLISSLTEQLQIINCRKMALKEVNDAFYLITKIPHVHMAKMWVPYKKCDFISSKASCMELALSTNCIEALEGHEYMPADEVHWIHVQPRKGIIGMALESESKSCFCRDVSEFNIIDQPLALNDRSERLDVCFAICLQSSHTGDLTYVLEFFLNPSPQYLESFFEFLLPIMKQELKSFKYACGKQLGEELVVDVIQFSEASNPAFSELGQLDDVPIKFRSVQYGQMEHQQAEEPVQYVSDGMQTEQCRVAAASVSKKTEKGKRKTGFHLSLEVLEPHFGKKLKDVAKELSVGRSTIKRACRYHNIGRWPCNEKQTRNPYLYEKEKEQDSQQDVQPSSSGNLRQLDTHQNGPCTNTERLIVEEEVEKVMMIKVRSEEDIIKFELCLSLGVGKLLEEVATRLNLKMGTFKLKYLDEDNDEILVTCDADLQLCLKSQKTMGKTCIELFLRY